MKKNYFFILIILFPLILNAQWNKSNIDSVLFLNAASFLNRDTFIISTDGKLERTTNGGESFSSLTNHAVGAASYLVYKSFDTIYLAGTGTNTKGLLVSYDAGATWSKKILLMPNGDTAFKNKALIYFDFFDQSNGIIFGDSLNGLAQVFLTKNGGLTWEFYSHPSIDLTINADIDLFNLYSTSKNNCIFSDGTAKLLIGNNSRLLSLSDYGKVWHLDSSTTNKITRIAFKDPVNGISRMNVPSGFAVTNDGGKTWKETPDSSKRSNGNLLYVKPTAKYPGFYLASTSKATGESNISFDEGITWQLFDTLNHGGGNVFFKDAETGVCKETGINKSPVYYYRPSIVGLKELNQSSKSALYGYPNPTSDKVNFSMVYQSLELYDTQGRLVCSFAKTDHIDVSGIQNGLYWIKATDSRAIQYTQKLLIQH